MRYCLLILLLPSIAMADHTVQVSYGSFFDLDRIVDHGHSIDVTHMVDVYQDWDVGLTGQWEWGTNRNVDLRMGTLHAAVRYAPRFGVVQPYAQLSAGYTSVRWDIELMQESMRIKEHSFTTRARAGLMLSNPANVWSETVGIFFEVDRLIFNEEAVGSFRGGVSILY